MQPKILLCKSCSCYYFSSTYFQKKLKQQNRIQGIRTDFEATKHNLKHRNTTEQKLKHPKENLRCPNFRFVFQPNLGMNQQHIIIQAASSRSKEIYSIVNMAARREASANEDLSSRCLSLLDEVKDLIEAHKSGQSGENQKNKRQCKFSQSQNDCDQYNIYQKVSIQDCSFLPLENNMT